MNLLICEGAEVKATGEGKVSGTLVRFSGPESPDKSVFRDYFTKSTDFDVELPAKSSVYYHHGLDKSVGKKKIGTGEMSMKDDGSGIFIEAILDLSIPQVKKMYDEMLAGTKSMGWSSGTAPHLVERKKVGDSHEILKWPLGLDATITPTPAEPNNKVAVKSIEDFEIESLRTGATIDDHFKGVLTQLEGLLEREADLKELRTNQGQKALSNAMAYRVRCIQDLVERLLAEVTPVPGADQILYGLADLTIMDIERRSSMYME